MEESSLFMQSLVKIESGLFVSRLLSTSMDSNKEDEGPVENARPLVAFFYISYIIVIAFFMVRTFDFFIFTY